MCIADLSRGNTNFHAFGLGAVKARRTSPEGEAWCSCVCDAPKAHELGAIGSRCRWNIMQDNIVWYNVNHCLKHKRKKTKNRFFISSFCPQKVCFSFPHPKQSLYDEQKQKKPIANCVENTFVLHNNTKRMQFEKAKNFKKTECFFMYLFSCYCFIFLSRCFQIACGSKK